MGAYTKMLNKRIRRPLPPDVVGKITEALTRKSLKGDFDGNCNRSACQEPIKGNNWFNTSTRRYYCQRCAGDINLFALRAEGLQVCVAVTDPHDQPPFPLTLVGEPA